MKANRKFRDNDDGVANVVSTLMIIAIVVPLMSVMLFSFTGMVMKQIEMMETTAAILEDALVHLQETTGYEVHTGYGLLFKANHSITVSNDLPGFSNSTHDDHITTVYLIGHKHEIPNSDINDMYYGCYNYSGYYPLGILPTELTDEVEYNEHLNIKFKVNEIDTYFEFVVPHAYAIWEDVSGGGFDYNYRVVNITSNMSIAISQSIGYNTTYTTVPMYMVNVLEIEKRI